MRVIEQSVIGKCGDSAVCEDVIALTDTFVVLVDGATDKTGWRHNGVAGGRFAVDALKDAIKGVKEDIDAMGFVAHLSRTLSRALDDASADNPVPEDRPSAQLVAYSCHRREIWAVGDCSWLVEGVDESTRSALDDVASRARAAVTRALLIGGATVDGLLRSDPGREMILPLLEKQHLFRNTLVDPGFAIPAIDGTTVPAELITVRGVEPGTEVVFASDGYPKALASLAESEAYLADSLRKDPLRVWMHPSTKGVRPGQVSYDDRAYIRFVTE